MSKSKSGKPARKSRDDRRPTLAERRRETRYLQKHGGAHVARPANGLIQDDPGHTIDRCKAVINRLAHIEQPFSGAELDAAEADVLLLVVAALDHASKVIHSVGAQADVEMGT